MMVGSRPRTSSRAQAELRSKRGHGHSRSGSSSTLSVATAGGAIVTQGSSLARPPSERFFPLPPELDLDAFQKKHYLQDMSRNKEKWTNMAREYYTQCTARVHAAGNHFGDIYHGGIGITSFLTMKLGDRLMLKDGASLNHKKYIQQALESARNAADFCQSNALIFQPSTARNLASPPPMLRGRSATKSSASSVSSTATHNTNATNSTKRRSSSGSNNKRLRHHVSLLQSEWVGPRCMMVACYVRLRKVDRARSVADEVLNMLEASCPIPSSRKGSSSSMSSRQRQSSMPPNDMLSGRAGALQAILLLRQELQDPAYGTAFFVAQARYLLTTGFATARSKSSSVELVWEGSTPTAGLTSPRNTPKFFLGTVHGTVGILHTILGMTSDEWKELDKQLPRAFDMIRLAIDSLSTQVYKESGNLKPTLNSTVPDRLVEWSHGAPGYCLLLLRASQVYESCQTEYIQQAAKLAHAVVWKRGLLTKGIGLGYGITGNAYVFLALSHVLQANQMDDAMLWKQRAMYYLHYAADHLSSLLEIPNRPYSVFGGLGGLAVLCLDIQADIEREEAAAPEDESKIGDAGKIGVYFPLYQSSSYPHPCADNAAVQEAMGIVASPSAEEKQRMQRDTAEAARQERLFHQEQVHVRRQELEKKKTTATMSQIKSKSGRQPSPTRSGQPMPSVGSTFPSRIIRPRFAPSSASREQRGDSSSPRPVPIEIKSKSTGHPRAKTVSDSPMASSVNGMDSPAIGEASIGPENAEPFRRRHLTQVKQRLDLSTPGKKVTAPKKRSVNAKRSTAASSSSRLPMGANRRKAPVPRHTGQRPKKVTPTQPDPAARSKRKPPVPKFRRATDTKEPAQHSPTESETASAKASATTEPAIDAAMSTATVPAEIVNEDHVISSEKPHEDDPSAKVTPAEELKPQDEQPSSSKQTEPTSGEPKTDATKQSSSAAEPSQSPSPPRYMSPTKSRLSPYEADGLGSRARTLSFEKSLRSSDSSPYRDRSRSPMAPPLGSTRARPDPIQTNMSAGGDPAQDSTKSQTARASSPRRVPGSGDSRPSSTRSAKLDTPTSAQEKKLMLIRQEAAEKRIKREERTKKAAAERKRQEAEKEAAAKTKRDEARQREERKKLVEKAREMKRKKAEREKRAQLLAKNTEDARERAKATEAARVAMKTERLAQTRIEKQREAEARAAEEARLAEESRKREVEKAARKKEAEAKTAEMERLAEEMREERRQAEMQSAQKKAVAAAAVLEEAKRQAAEAEQKRQLELERKVKEEEEQILKKLEAEAQLQGKLKAEEEAKARAMKEEHERAKKEAERIKLEETAKMHAQVELRKMKEEHERQLREEQEATVEAEEKACRAAEDELSKLMQQEDIKMQADAILRSRGDGSGGDTTPQKPKSLDGILKKAENPPKVQAAPVPNIGNEESEVDDPTAGLDILQQELLNSATELENLVSFSIDDAALNKPTESKPAAPTVVITPPVSKPVDEIAEKSESKEKPFENSDVIPAAASAATSASNATAPTRATSSKVRASSGMSYAQVAAAPAPALASISAPAVDQHGGIKQQDVKSPESNAVTIESQSSQDLQDQPSTSEDVDEERRAAESAALARIKAQVEQATKRMAADEGNSDAIQLPSSESASSDKLHDLPLQQHLKNNLESLRRGGRRDQDEAEDFSVWSGSTRDIETYVSEDDAFVPGALKGFLKAANQLMSDKFDSVLCAGTEHEHTMREGRTFPIMPSYTDDSGIAAKTQDEQRQRSKGDEAAVAVATTKDQESPSQSDEHTGQVASNIKSHSTETELINNQGKGTPTTGKATSPKTEAGIEVVTSESAFAEEDADEGKDVIRHNVDSSDKTTAHDDEGENEDDDDYIPESLRSFIEDADRVMVDQIEDVMALTAKPDKSSFESEEYDAVMAPAIDELEATLAATLPTVEGLAHGGDGAKDKMDVDEDEPALVDERKAQPLDNAVSNQVAPPSEQDKNTSASPGDQPQSTLAEKARKVQQEASAKPRKRQPPCPEDFIGNVPSRSYSNGSKKQEMETTNAPAVANNATREAEQSENKQAGVADVEMNVELQPSSDSEDFVPDSMREFLAETDKTLQAGIDDLLKIADDDAAGKRVVRSEGSNNMVELGMGDEEPMKSPSTSYDEAEGGAPGTKLSVMSPVESSIEVTLSSDIQETQKLQKNAATEESIELSDIGISNVKTPKGSKGGAAGKKGDEGGKSNIFSFGAKPQTPRLRSAAPGFRMGRANRAQVAPSPVNESGKKDK